MRAVAVAAFLLSFVASISAYTVTFPNGVDGWTDKGPQLLNWTHVSTDPLNFTAVLDNQSIQGFQAQVLAALISGELGSIQLNPQNGGWPTGSQFRVNLVKDDLDLNTILAQSDHFNITPVTNSSSTSNLGTLTPVTTATPTGATQTDTSGASSSSAITIPTSGATSYPVQTGLLALFSLIGFALA